MSSGKHKKYHFTFKTVIRLVIFGLILCFLITYLSSKRKSSISQNASVLGAQIASSSALSNLYNKIPENSRHQIENFNTSPMTSFFQGKFQEFQKLTHGFPETQIKELQKYILKTTYDSMLKNIDKP